SAPAPVLSGKAELRSCRFFSCCASPCVARTGEHACVPLSLARPDGEVAEERKVALPVAREAHAEQRPVALERHADRLEGAGSRRTGEARGGERAVGVAELVRP